MKKIVYRLVLPVCAVLLTGCGRGSKPDVSSAHIYYVNNKDTSLVEESYEFKGGSVKKELENALNDLQKKQDSDDYKSPFPDGVKVEDWELAEGKLDLYFGASYSEMKPSQEVLLRAAVVKTTVQIAGIDYVDFYIGGQPLVDHKGEQVGYMRAEDFVQNMGSSLHSYQMADLTLYFPNEKGDMLEAEEVSVRYNSNMSVEKLIVEQMIKGPSLKGRQPSLSPDTTVLGVSVKDGICYVNFDKEFLNSPYTVDPQIAVYSLVNSIIDGGTASQVQISVNGDTNVSYQGAFDLSKPLSRNLDMIKEEGND